MAGSNSSGGAPPACPSETRARLADGTCVDRITEFKVGETPRSIAINAQGRIWFEDVRARQIVEMNDRGEVITRLELPEGTGHSELLGGSGEVALWYTDSVTVSLSQVTKGRERKSFLLAGYLIGIALGPNGNLWVADQGRAIYEVTPAGAPVKSVPSGPSGALCVGPDGNLWYPQAGNFTILRMLPSGETEEFPSSDGFPSDICAGPDDALWFTDPDRDLVGRLTLDKNLTLYSLLPSSGPERIARGRDDAVWFTQKNVGKIGRIAMDGSITHYALPRSDSLPHGIAVARDGTVWFTELNTGQVGRLIPDSMP